MQRFVHGQSTLCDQNVDVRSKLRRVVHRTSTCDRPCAVCSIASAQLSCDLLCVSASQNQYYVKKKWAQRKKKMIAAARAQAQTPAMAQTPGAQAPMADAIDMLAAAAAAPAPVVPDVTAKCDNPDCDGSPRPSGRLRPGRLSPCGHMLCSHCWWCMNTVCPVCGDDVYDVLFPDW